LIFISIAEHNFDLVTDLSISEIALDESVVDLNVGHFSHGLEHHIAWNQEFLFVINELHHAVTVGQVMNGDCLSKHIVSHASHLNSICREETASVDESWSLESNWIVSFIHDQHSNNSFVTINDEISTELIAIFFSLGQLFL
tara:strand:- start:339 stop:764 length:426 start_codon:yes stop_codon:yes gene_type:complete